MNPDFNNHGVIQEGDRVVGVNDLEITNQSAEQVNQLIRDHRHRCDLTIEYDVAGQDQAKFKISNESINLKFTFYL